MTTVASLPITLKLGPVHLNVTDLDRSVAWYERSLGLRQLSGENGVAEMGDGLIPSVVLHEQPGARPPADDEAEMFHYCLLFETREELARAAVRLHDTATPVTHMNDRHTHEAIYLDDPDGIHVELAWDRPRDQWPESPYGHPPVELDLQGLLATVADETMSPSVAEGLRVGHVHLTVGDIEQAIAFYRDQLGLDLRYFVSTSEKYKTGAFFSIGGYHHHTAANIAKGAGVGPLPEHAVGLRSWTFQLPGADDVAAAAERLDAAGRELEELPHGVVVRDPWAIPLRIVS